MPPARHNAAVLVALVAVLLIGPGWAMAQGYAPEDAAGKMTLPDGFTVSLVASEPEIRQPILVKCDERGRLWVIQYLQYPNPAGLKRVKVDRWSRTVYDRVPEPPPHGPKGADRITILEDTDGDGRTDRFHDFVDGLNLCTGLAFGHGGVFVLQVPYLLFYPDRDRDDVPDGDPEVLLSGFGMEDAQSLANHLTWGPDGWLYGVNGSTTTCNIRDIEFQQGCWRYHPLTKEFELFCEGGGNTYGLTFDERGNLYYSTNGGPFVHAVQGGYYYKSFGKHGPLHNLYAYGFYPELKRDQVPGGPPTGGTIYLGDSFPVDFRGTFISGNFLGHTVSWWNLKPRGTTVEAALGGSLLDAHDTWFGATDVCLAPDGSLYVCDFCDQRTGHPDPDANWDRSNGRVYKIEAASTKHIGPIDLARRSSRELVDLLNHRNRWYADQARCLLAVRRDPSIVPRLREMALQSKNGLAALQGLWALHVTAGLDDALAGNLLAHTDEYVRSWTVRLLGDRRIVSAPIARRLRDLAASDSSAIVRCQLAATARRLPAGEGLPIVEGILERGLDEDDPYVPWLLWWAIENKAVSDAELVLERFARPENWRHASYRGNLRRLARRYAAEGTAAGYAACLRLLSATPEAELPAMHESLAQGLSERSGGLRGVEHGGLFEQFANVDHPEMARQARPYEPLTAELRDYVASHWQAHPDDRFWLLLALRSDLPPAYQAVLHSLDDSSGGGDGLIASLGLLQEFGQADCLPAVLKHVDPSAPAGVLSAALAVLGRFESDEAATRLLAIYSDLSADLRSKVRDVLFGRPSSTRQFLQLVAEGRIDPQEVPIDQLRRVSLFQDAELDALVRKHWGNIQPGTPEEKLATMRRLSNDLRAGAGDPTNGKELYKKHCTICHQLFGEGNKVGPELTKANRADRDALLANLVDPSAVIRKEYMSYVLSTSDGRIATGLLAEQDAASVTLLDAKNQRLKFARSEIEELEESAVSLMPDNVLAPLTPQELRDLFSYLQSSP